MSILTIIEYIALPLFLLAIVGFLMCAISLVRAVFGRRKIPSVSILVFLVPFLLILASKHVALKTLKSSVFNNSITVSVTPSKDASPKQFINTVIDNIYTNKGASGSHPTKKIYNIELCLVNNCHVYTLAQDSRDSEVFWVSFIPFKGGVYPLGFTKLDNEKI